MSNQAVKIFMFDHSHDHFELQGLPAKGFSADSGLLVFQKLIIIFTCILLLKVKFTQNHYLRFFPTTVKYKWHPL